MLSEKNNELDQMNVEQRRESSVRSSNVSPLNRKSNASPEKYDSMMQF